MSQMKRLLHDYILLIGPELEEELFAADHIGVPAELTTSLLGTLTREQVLDFYKKTGQLVIPSVSMIQRMLTMTTDSPTIGWSDFALKNSVKSKGRSYTTLNPNRVIEICENHWPLTKEPGDGETDCSRKVLVSVSPTGFFLPPKAKLVEGLPVQAEVVKREGQTNEDPYIEIFVTPQDAAKFGYVEQPAKSVKIVLYSAEALTENNEKRSTDCEWEIVAILCSENDGETEPMAPLTMARNFLEKEGGTKSVYTAQEFAEAIYSKSNSGVRVRPRS